MNRRLSNAVTETHQTQRTTMKIAAQEPRVTSNTSHGFLAPVERAWLRQGSWTSLVAEVQ